MTSELSTRRCDSGDCEDKHMSARYPTSSQLGGERSGSAPPVMSRRGRPILRPIISMLRRPLSPVIVALTGRRRLRSFAVIHHRGRRSGRAYITPVSARPIPGGFIIPLSFGEGADWFQNLRAAGGGVIRWNGGDYAVNDPVVVNREAARPAFSALEQVLLPLMGIEKCVRVRCGPIAAHDPEGEVRAATGQATGEDSSELSHTRAS